MNYEQLIEVRAAEYHAEIRLMAAQARERIATILWLAIFDLADPLYLRHGGKN